VRRSEHVDLGKTKRIHKLLLGGISTVCALLAPELSILTTDDNGFLNHPTAIVKKVAGKRIGVVGLGDFFIHGVAYPFTEFFEQRGIVYYNPAMHRQGTTAIQSNSRVLCRGT